MPKLTLFLKALSQIALFNHITCPYGGYFDDQRKFHHGADCEYADA